MKAAFARRLHAVLLLAGMLVGVGLGPIAAASVVLWPSAAQADNRVIVRGNYYREASTRVLQPTVEVTVDVPDERLTLGAGYVLDAISSASIATGTTAVTGGDNVFTEIRHEANVNARSRIGDWGFGGFFRYSSETDYTARSIGAAASRDLLARSVTLSLSYAYNFDRFYRIINAFGARLPWCGGAVAVQDCQAGGRGVGHNLTQVHYIAGGYTHAVHKTVLTQLTTGVAHVRGPQDNPYRGMQIVAATPETHPSERTRLALAGALRWIVPKAHMVVEPRYRFNVDTWQIRAHAPEIRLHVRVFDHVRLRLRYRYYTQTQAFFWRDAGDYIDGDGLCTRDEPENCASADPKMDDWHSHTPGIAVVYELDGLAKFRGLGFLDRGWLSATYNHMFQSNRFGQARIGALAFSLAF